MNNRESGYFAEFLVRIFLRLKGYQIICKNHITGRGTTAGEIDIIALKKHTLVFAEVKKRQTLEDAAYAISSKQQKRIINAALFFLQKNPQFNNYQIRFDAVLVKFPCSIKHIQDAFRP